MGSALVQTKTVEKKGEAKAAGPSQDASALLDPSGAPQSIQGATAGMPRFLGAHLQAKLAVGAVDDPLEAEADRCVARGSIRYPAETVHPEGSKVH